MTATHNSKAPPRILVVDDSRMIRSMLLRLLEPLEAVVATAEDGAEALELAQSEPFDLVISDIEMPHMDGFELCRRLKQQPDTQATPVIILSTIDTEESIEQGFTIGAAAYVTKRNVNTDLIPRIEEVLRRTFVLKGRDILLVDDSPFILKTLGDALRQAGLCPHTASDGVEALKVLETLTPDIIVSDIRMPNMDGAAFCEEVKRREGLANVPFLVMSAISDRRVMREMTGRGAAAYLVKPFNVEQLIMATERLLSEQVQILLEENRRHQDERAGLLRSLFDVIKAWEARDPMFANHSAAVARLAGAMGRVMGFDAASLEKLETAARLHDLGKVALHDAVHYKAGALNPEEFEAVKRHPELGAEMLRHARGMADIIPGVLHHHERVDGGGYPHGLTGESIPLLARIIAVADTYAALVSRRPHRPAYAPDKARQIIDDARGKTLCPACVDAFFRHMDRMRKPEPKAQTAPDKARKGKALAEASILLVDHNRSFLGFLRRTLIEQGAGEVLTAQDGRAAWDVINEATVDLVVCDRDAPRLDGEELLARVRNSEAFQQLPFIMTSSQADKNHFKRALDLLVSDYLLKPLTQADLLAKIKKVLSQSSYLQELDSEQSRSRELAPEEFSNVLIEGVLQSHEIFCATVTKRFRFHVRALIGDQLAPEHEPRIDEGGERYSQQIRQAHTSAYINSVIELLHGIMDYQTGQSGERILPGRRVRDVSRRFVEKSRGIFRRNFTNCLESLPDFECSEADVEEAVEDFNAGYRNILTRSDMRTIEILTIGNRYNDMKNRSSLEQIRFLKEIHTPKMNWINLVDAFGRGLLEPVEMRYDVVDCDPCSREGAESFPRVFCSPVLKTIKNLIVGKDKYNQTNSVFLNKVSQYCEARDRFEPDEVKDFFTQGKIRFYIASYLLYILKMLMDDKKKEAFLLNVNNSLRKVTGSDKYVLDTKHYQMMTSSWARFIYENMSKLKSRKTTAKILRRYAPELFTSAGESRSSATKPQPVEPAADSGA